MAAINPKVIAELRALQTDGSNFLVELIDLFLREAAGHIAKLRAGIEAGDLVPVEKSAHTLKGSAGNLGALPLSRLCADLQSAARAGDRVRSKELVGLIEQEYAVASAELEGEKTRR